MATTPQRPPPLTREQVDNPNAARDQGGTVTTQGRPAQTAKQRYQDRVKQEAEADKAADDIAYKKATQGIVDEDTRDKILALGGDATRSSPAMEQNLGDPTPGLTTTTGAYRSPIDPTTAAVPADPDSDFVRRAPRGWPTVGAGREGGQPEQRWKKREQAAQADDPEQSGYPADEPSSPSPSSAPTPRQSAR